MERFKAAARVWASPIIALRADREVSVDVLETHIYTSGPRQTTRGWQREAWVTNVFEYDSDEVEAD